MTHIIITGAYGLVGRNFIKAIPAEWKITTIKFNEIPKNLEPADYIVHGAGYGQPQMFMKDEISTIKINTDFTTELFKYLKPDGKFLFISTSEVYSGAPSPYKETDIGTTTPIHPRACYIEGKRCGEAICMAFRRKGFDVKIARLSLAYGEGTKSDDTRVLNQFIKQALTKGKIELLDMGEAKRTYCYIGDVVKILWAILLEGKESVYNVGGISKTTVADLARKIGEITGAEVVFPNIKGGLTGAPEDVELDMSKVMNEFSFKGFVSLDAGLKLTIKWQKEHLYA